MTLLNCVCSFGCMMPRFLNIRLNRYILSGVVFEIALLPFAIVLSIGVYSLYIGFTQEVYVDDAVQKALKTAKNEHLLLEAVTTAVQNEGESAQPEGSSDSR